MAFSPDIFRYNVRMLVKVDSGIKSIEDLQGKSVVTTTGTTSFRLLRDADKGKNLDVTNVAGKDHTDSFLLAANGRAQAFVLDDILLAGPDRQREEPEGLRHHRRELARVRVCCETASGLPVLTTVDSAVRALRQRLQA